MRAYAIFCCNRFQMTVLNVFVVLLLFVQGCYSRVSCTSQFKCPRDNQDVYRSNDLREIPENVKAVATEVFFVQTSISVIKKHAFKNNPNLQKIYFIENDVTAVEAGAFETLPDLIELEISGNDKLQELTVGAFNNLSKLKKLSLKGNKINKLENNIFDQLSNVEDIQLHMNDISYLPNNIFDRLITLKRLHLAKNKLTSIPRDIFKKLKSLTSLRLYENEITDLPEDAFDSQSQLTELSVYGNKIKRLQPNIFSKLYKLEKLALEKNMIEEFPEGIFSGLEKLKELKLFSNQLTKLPNRLFGRINKLTELDFSKNNLTSIPNELFANLTNLKKLNFADNQISTLPNNAFVGLKQLTSLHLGNNKLKDLKPETFSSLLRLTTLNLFQNLLQHVPEGFFDNFSKLNSVNIGNNPWVCDCHLHYLYQWIKQNPEKLKPADNTLCETPEKFKGRSIDLLSLHDLICLITTSASTITTKSLTSPDFSTVTETIKSTTEYQIILTSSSYLGATELFSTAVSDAETNVLATSTDLGTTELFSTAIPDMETIVLATSSDLHTTKLFSSAYSETETNVNLVITTTQEMFSTESIVSEQKTLEEGFQSTTFLSSTAFDTTQLPTVFPSSQTFPSTSVATSLKMTTENSVTDQMSTSSEAIGSPSIPNENVFMSIALDSSQPLSTMAFTRETSEMSSDVTTEDDAPTEWFTSVENYSLPNVDLASVVTSAMYSVTSLSAVPTAIGTKNSEKGTTEGGTSALYYPEVTTFPTSAFDPNLDNSTVDSSVVKSSPVMSSIIAMESVTEIQTSTFDTMIEASTDEHFFDTVKPMLPVSLTTTLNMNKTLPTTIPWCTNVTLAFKNTVASTLVMLPTDIRTTYLESEVVDTDTVITISPYEFKGDEKATHGEAQTKYSKSEAWDLPIDIKPGYCAFLFSSYCIMILLEIGCTTVLAHYCYLIYQSMPYNYSFIEPVKLKKILVKKV
ncbi:platelet glycoprotein Ib alpha chain-like [Protopterus annectens]|uniref:platelet glycoprotein Ib alpha chain-like n=1 Tax=Protopterus annectens TaxID=7888 RepID=UPI001CFABB6D|nr:platelet glycoprotein Ib alpha chain-like [Protopterus annectens]